MFRARVDGKMVEGKPLSWTADQMLLLGRDGKLYEFNPKTAKEAQKTSPRFFGYSPSEVKGQLQKEFGKQFEVSATRHYLVVHPQGEKDEWANRFEDLYKRFEHYFRVRGFKLEEPPYPLVAVVFRNQGEYRRHAEASGIADAARYARPLRIQIRTAVFLLRFNDGEASALVDKRRHDHPRSDASNGVQHGHPSRFTDTPRWLVEGLATMFEARGVWNRAVRSHAGRPNQPRSAGQLQALRCQRWQPGMMTESGFIGSDVRQRCVRRVRRGVGAVVLPVRDAAAAVLPILGKDGRAADVRAIHGRRARGRFRGHLRQRVEDVRDEVPALHGRSEVARRTRRVKNRPCGPAPAAPTATRRGRDRRRQLGVFGRLPFTVGLPSS